MMQNVTSSEAASPRLAPCLEEPVSAKHAPWARGANAWNWKRWTEQATH